MFLLGNGGNRNGNSSRAFGANTALRLRRRYNTHNFTKQKQNKTKQNEEEKTDKKHKKNIHHGARTCNRKSASPTRYGLLLDHSSATRPCKSMSRFLHNRGTRTHKAKLGNIKCTRDRTEVCREMVYLRGIISLAWLAKSDSVVLVRHQSGCCATAQQ